MFIQKYRRKKFFDVQLIKRFLIENLIEFILLIFEILSILQK